MPGPIALIVVSGGMPAPATVCPTTKALPVVATEVTEVVPALRSPLPVAPPSSSTPPPKVSKKLPEESNFWTREDGPVIDVDISRRIDRDPGWFMQLTCGGTLEPPPAGGSRRVRPGPQLCSSGAPVSHAPAPGLDEASPAGELGDPVVAGLGHVDMAADGIGRHPARDRKSCPAPSPLTPSWGVCQRNSGGAAAALEGPADEAIAPMRRTARMTLPTLPASRVCGPVPGAVVCSLI